GLLCWSTAAPPRAGPRHLSQLATQPARNAERVVDLDPEVMNRAFELRMPEQQLNRSQVTRLLVDLGRLRSPHRMRAVGGVVEPGALDPGIDDPRVLPGRDVWLRAEAAREEVSSVPGLDLGKPGSDRSS